MGTLTNDSQQNHDETKRVGRLMLFALGWTIIDEPQRVKGALVENYATAI